jgi:beta-ureidopropionase
MIVSPRGEVLAEGSATAEDIVLADVDLSTLPALRSLWGYYRDRRPDKYGPVVDLPAGGVHPTGASELTASR